MGIERSPQYRAILHIAYLHFGRIFFLWCGNDLHVALNDVQKRIQFRNSIRELFMEFPMQFINYILVSIMILILPIPPCGTA